MGKLNELQNHMREVGIVLLCIQETHIEETLHFYDDGFLVVLSGKVGQENGRFFSGVIFLVAPIRNPCSSGFQADVGQACNDENTNFWKYCQHYLGLRAAFGTSI